MSTDTEEVERKVDGEAEGEPGNDRLVRGENDTAEDPSYRSGTGGFLTDMDVDRFTVARVSLAFLLFGGIALTFIAAGLWVREVLGPYPFWIVTGVGAMVFSYVLAQVYARRGWI